MSARILALLFSKIGTLIAWFIMYYAVKPFWLFYVTLEQNRRDKRLRILFYRGFLLLVGSLIVLLFFSNYEVIHTAQGKTFNEVSDLEPKTVGLLLGTSKYMKNGRINPYYKTRLEAASILYFEGKICALLISGDHSRHDYNEPLDFKTDLIQLGIPEDCIYLDYAGFRTLDSMIRAKEIFGQKSLIVISQEFHNQRAIYLAEKHQLSAIGFNAKEIKGSFALKTNLREYLARGKAFLDVVLKKGPKFLGPTIRIEAQ